MPVISKCYQTLYKFRRELLLFLLLLFTFLWGVPPALHEWNSAWYSMDYSLGFDSRLLIGSILKCFYPQYLPSQAAYLFVFFSIILFLLVLSLILGCALRRNDKTKGGLGLLIIVIFYLVCPGSPAYHWSIENFGRFDLYLILLTLMAAFAGLTIKSFWVRLVVFTVAGTAAICVHQVFLFIFFPLLFTFYMDMVAEQKYRKLSLISCCLSFMLLGGVFVYFQFFSSIHAASPEALAELLRARTDLPINDRALSLEYFTSLKETVTTLSFSNLPERLRYTAVTLALLSPVLIVYSWLWRQILRLSTGRSFKYVMILASQLCYIPAFVLTIDWGRWLGAFLTIQALQIIYLAAKKDAVIMQALASLNALFHRHPYAFILSGLWLSCLDKFQAVFLPNASVLYTSLYQIYSAIF